MHNAHLLPNKRSSYSSSNAIAIEIMLQQRRQTCRHDMNTEIAKTEREQVSQQKYSLWTEY